MIANFQAAKQLRKSNGISISKQLKSNRENIDKQIKNAELIALSQFKANLATNNRQDWIDSIRENLSDFVSTCVIVPAHFSNKNQKFTVENQGEIFKKLTYLQTKIKLLLNSKYKRHNAIIERMNKLMDQCVDVKSEADHDKLLENIDDLISASQDFFEHEWDKIRQA